MAINFEGYTVPKDFRSDGCTLARDSWFGISIWRACYFHDFLRRYGLERRIVADFYGAKAIAQLLPWWGFWIPVFYFIGMSWGSFWEWISELQGEYQYDILPDKWKSTGYLPKTHPLLN